MLTLAKLSIRRPRAALAVWAIVAVALTLIGLGVSGSLSPSIVVVPGSESSRAEKLAEDEFGPSVLVPILLEGPARQLDRQGPKLVVALDKRPDPVLLPAAVAVLGRRSWWPTRGGAEIGTAPTQPLSSTTPGVRT
jgi:uncharacterized membrane protein YdfJ with MMPL/SSD domain